MLGNVVIFMLCVSIPTFILLSLLNYWDGTLTLTWALYIAMLCAALAVVIGVPFWFFVVRRILRRRQEGA